MDGTSGIFHILYIIGRAKRAPHGRYIWDFSYIIIYYRTYVGVCVTPLFFFFGVRCAQYKVHAQCSFAALAPHMPCMLLVYYILYIIDVRETALILRWRRTAHRLTAHAHRCVKLQGQSILNKVRKGMQAKSKR